MLRQGIELSQGDAVSPRHLRREAVQRAPPGDRGEVASDARPRIGCPSSHRAS